MTIIAPAILFFLALFLSFLVFGAGVNFKETRKDIFAIVGIAFAGIASLLALIAGTLL